MSFIGRIGLLAVATVSQMVRFVDAYDRQVLTVFHEYRTLLEAGINSIPLFVSQTYTFR